MKNPMGFLYFISTVDSKYHKIQRFVFAEDTGSAIKGQIRFDFFWGSGNESGSKAGKTNEKVKRQRVSTTLAKQLALYVVIYSPLQMASDFIENYYNMMTAYS